jgi:ABC-2 type transport system ATP-binding protein
MEYVIETTGLTKNYGYVKAVDEVSLSVKKGEIYGFLGLNGAGKTTTIRMLLGMVRPVSGGIRLCGNSILSGGKGPWEKVGYMVEMPYAYPELTVRENLEAIRLLRDLKDKTTVSDIIHKLDLKEYENIKARNLSLGNSQRLGLAKALIHRPEILILDEPSNGLDPSGIVEIRELLQNLAEKEGSTIFVSSHNLSEVSKIATRIGIIHRGRLIQEKNAAMLENELSQALLIRVRNKDAALSFLKNKNYETQLTDDLINLTGKNVLENPEEINKMLVTAGFPPYFLKVEKEDLESYFLRMIGEKV